MSKYLTKLISLILSFSLILEQSLFAQSIDFSHYFANSAKPVLQSDKFRPLHLRSLGYDNLSNDFKILLDKGDTKKEDLENKTYIAENTQTLLKYFFIGLALPNEKFWVNLRPDSPDNILDPDLEKTDIGRIFLEADVQLKKDTAGMTSPQTPQGKAYWDKLYEKAGELFGTENITIPTITRPWIVPNEIIIREAPDNAYIYKATLKVMLEEDYLTGRGERPFAPTYQQYTFSDPRLKELNQYSTQLIKESIIPKLTYEVNTSKRYAPLRQVYYSLILAQWFKTRYRSQMTENREQRTEKANNYLSLIDSGNLTNLTLSQPYDKQRYFQQYQKSFKDGEYNLTKPVYTPMGQSIRRYMSGGASLNVLFTGATLIESHQRNRTLALLNIPSYLSAVTVAGSPIKGVSSAAALSSNSGERIITYLLNEFRIDDEDNERIKGILTELIALNVLNEKNKEAIIPVITFFKMRYDKVGPIDKEDKIWRGLQDLIDQGKLTPALNIFTYRYGTIYDIYDILIALARGGQLRGNNMDTVGNFLISIAEQVGHIQIHIIDCLPVLSFFLGERFITFLQDELNDIRFIDFLKKERSEIIAFWEALKENNFPQSLNFFEAFLKKRDISLLDIVKPMIDDKLLLYNPSLSRQLQDILSFHADYKTMVAAIGYSVDMNIISKGADIPIAPLNKKIDVLLARYLKNELKKRELLENLRNIQFSLQNDAFKKILQRNITQEENNFMEGSLVAPYLPVIISVYFKIKNTHKEISRKIAIALNELLIKKDILSFQSWLYTKADWNKYVYDGLIKSGYSPSLWNEEIRLKFPVKVIDKNIEVNMKKHTKQLIELAKKYTISVSGYQQEGFSSYAKAEKFAKDNLSGRKITPEDKDLIGRVLREADRLEGAYEMNVISSQSVTVEIGKDFLKDTNAGLGIPGCFSPHGAENQMPFAHSLEVNTFFLKVYNENGKMIANTVLVLTPQGIVVHPLYNASNIYLEEVLFISLARLLLNGWIPRILFEETSGGWKEAVRYAEKKETLAVKLNMLEEQLFFDFFKSNSEKETTFNMPFMVTKDDLSRKGFNYAVVHPQKEIMLPPILSKEDKNLIKERLLKLNIDAQLGELLKKIETIVVISSEKEVEAIVSSLNKRTLPYKPISQEDKDKLMGELSTVREEFFPYAEQVLSYTPYLIQELDIFSSTELPLEESKERVSLDLEGVNILIKVKDKIVGFITSTRENNDYSEDVDILKKYILEEDKVLYVDDIYIHPLLRNNHFVLLKLVRAFYNEAKAKGFLQIISHVRKSNGLSDFLKNRGAVFITTNKEWLKGEFFDLLVYMLDKAGPSAISAGESPPLGENQSVPTKQEIEAMLDRHKIDKTLLGLPDKLYAKIFFDEYKDKSLLSDDEHRKLFDFLWSINGLPDKLKFGLPVSLKKKIIQEENREKLKTVMGYLASGEIKSDVIELLKIVLEHPLPENEEEFLWECYDYKYANGEEERAVSSAINKSGGVDFSALPIVTQQIKSLQSLSSSSLSINPNFDLDAEWAQIQQIFNADIQPSIQRLLEFSVAASSSPAESRRKEDVIGLIADLLRREEENKKLAPTDPALKVLLSALEA